MVFSGEQRQAGADGVIEGGLHVVMTAGRRTDTVPPDWSPGSGKGR